MSDDPQAAMPSDPASPEAREYFATMTADVVARMNADIESGAIPPGQAAIVRSILDMNVDAIAGMSAMSTKLAEITGILDGDDMDKLASLLFSRLGTAKVVPLVARFMALLAHPELGHEE